MNRLLPFLCTVAVLGAQEGPAPVLKRASGHPMAYHLALPEGWKPGGRYPVVVAVEAAEMDFQRNARDFAAARGSRPFILVVPHTVSSGPSRYREAESFVYGAKDWAEVDRQGRWGFDEAGLQAVLADVRTRYGGEGKPFLTGWESAGHTVWAMALRHPECWRAVAPVSTNYLGRYLDAASSDDRCDDPVQASKDPARATLPVKVFFCDTLPSARNEAGRQGWLAQTRKAMALAEGRGFRPIAIEVVKGSPHSNQAAAVLAWFQECLKP